MRKNKLKQIMKVLKPFSNPNLPLKEHALSRLTLEELKEFQSFLENSPEAKNNLQRPECPVKNINYSSLAREPYKKETNNHLKEKWGYQFKSPSSITPSLYESLLNYLERTTNPNS